MANTKYKYNSATLSYEEVEMTWRDKLLRISYFAIVGLVISGILAIIFFRTIQESDNKELTSNNNLLTADLREVMDELELMEHVLEDIQRRDDNVYRSILKADPYAKHLRDFGTGGNPKLYEKYKGLPHSDLVIETRKKLDGIKRKIVAQSISIDSVVVLMKRRQDILRSTPSIQPISNKDLTRLASGFGMRTHPIYNIQKMHTGMDFTAPTGTEIYVTGDGKVEKTDWMSGYGQSVVINHGFGYKTLYAHCSEFKCKPGQKVKRGDVIALVGNTGLSSGPHLHYEVRRKQKNEDGRITYAPINPVNFFFNDLSPEEYDQMLEIARRPTESM